ncbi:hypothetical protein CMV_030279 [Castanea mollissima]|uniref:Rad60/SUMO-like domain-containing protein n=1 Tax=Castanea mollissima TaxID=60419 RepID=A0A8J4Q5M6_9ROSI|nr:hypothetical protein CMV_030279 [Castanea mollissima]
MSGVTNQEEDKKPTDQSAHINLKVKGQDGNEVFFRIKRSTQLKKLMNAYCDRQPQMSWKWRMEMRLMPCCTKQEVPLRKWVLQIEF